MKRFIIDEKTGLAYTLVGDYYIPRIKMYFSDKASGLDQWEEDWIMTPWTGVETSYENPVETALEIIRKNR